jgi:hypothetical protein
LRWSYAPAFRSHEQVHASSWNVGMSRWLSPSPHVLRDGLGYTRVLELYLRSAGRREVRRIGLDL